MLALIAAGCAGSARFVAVPKDLDRSNVPQQRISVTATYFTFEPSEIPVRAGTLLVLSIKSIRGTHGIRISDFGIDERLDENEEKTIELYLPSPGEYSFRCSHFCGLGHFGMSGKIVVK